MNMDFICNFFVFFLQRHTSRVGRQTVILKDCNIDGGVLTKFDANAEYLEEEMDFTFEDFEMPETFAPLAGME